MTAFVCTDGKRMNKIRQRGIVFCREGLLQHGNAQIGKQLTTGCQPFAVP